VLGQSTKELASHDRDDDDITRGRGDQLAAVPPIAVLRTMIGASNASTRSEELLTSEGRARGT
jgi:hypothetical protein